MVIVTAAREGFTPVETVYRQDGDRLWRALVAFGGDPDLANDAVAEAFAQALRRGAAINDVQAWVWRAAFRIAAGELNRRPLPMDRIPDRGYLATTADIDLLRALAQLPDKQRAAVILFYYADAPVREIARRTGMSQLSVRANLSRGRKRLKDLLGDTDA
ncbi:MAG: RNA polymerase sigma factor [Candidatus Limnocylindria bacterium]